MPLNDDQVRAVLDAMGRTHASSCDEFLDVMGQLAELQERGDALPDGLQHALEHLAACAGCAEELKAVRAALAG